MDTSQPLNLDNASFKSLDGKTIIVTGASSGIGLETAELFYELGSNVVFVGGRKIPTTYIPLDSPRVLICQCDIGSWDSQVDVFVATIEKFGSVDIVCPNAGVAEPQGQYFNLKLDDVGRPLPLDLKVIDVDMKGTAYSVALAFHYMKAKGGSVIIVSSRAGYGGMPEMPSYSASKHGATGLLRSLNSPASAHNIALSLVAPHITFTPGVFSKEYVRGRSAFEKMRDTLKPMGINLSSSLTCALAVAYLASGGLDRAGMGLLVEGDEIHNLEQAITDSRPEWWVKKSDNKKAREEYAKQMAQQAKSAGI